MYNGLKNSGIILFWLLLIGGVAFGVAPADAQTTSWLDSAGGSFSAPTNWSNGVPDSTTTANFGLPSSYDVNVLGGRNVRLLNIQNGDVSFLGNNSNVTAASGTTINGGDVALAGVNLTNLGFSGLLVTDGALTLNDSIVRSTSTSIGVSNLTGSLEISGSESRLEMTGGFEVGVLGGTGSVMINDGGRLELQSTGTTRIGNSGDGSTTTGTLSLTGIGSRLMAEDRIIEFGGAGTGNFLISDQAVAITDRAILRHGSAGNKGSATVTGEGSTWITEQLSVSGDSDLNVLDGARLVVNDRLWTFGGRFVFENADVVAQQISNSGGLIRFQGGASQISGDVINTGSSNTVQLDNASNVLFAGVVDSSNTSYLSDEGSEIDFRGGLRGTADFDGDGDVLINTELRPSGLLSFEGNLAFGSNLTTFIELGGNGLEEFDRLEIGSDLQLDGVLDVSMINDFVPELGDEFLIFDVDGSLSGQFIGLDEGSLVGSFGDQNLFISYTGGDGNDVALFATSAVPEPTSGAVLMLLMLGSISRRRRRTCSI